MIKVDLIIPSIIKSKQLFKYQKYHRFSFPSWTGNWFPVWLYRKELKDNYDIKVRFLNIFNLKYNKLSNVVGIDYRIMYNLFKNYEPSEPKYRKKLISILKRIKKKTDYLIYFDNGDSTGVTQFELLPYVDCYLKKQILKDRSIYTKELYRKRLFTDFYARKYFTTLDDEWARGFPLDSKYQHKVGLSWNFALKDYRYSNEVSQFFYGINRFSNNISQLKLQRPNKNRKIIFAANYNLKFNSELVAFQRIKLLNYLKEKYNSNPHVSIGKIPKKQYLQTLRSSKAIFSPYGWGEVCYRDFETFIAGAALIKPDMSQIETWPNIYKSHETYIPISWKIEDWEESIPNILNDEKLLLEVAKKGQESYKKLWTNSGRIKFCEHFSNIITPK